jgi:delta 1-pyrroline-5-carboxylate dehydrogenase
MPPGVVQFVPGVAEECGRVITESPHLAALHFTGSTSTFNHLWRSISSNISKYISGCENLPFCLASTESPYTLAIFDDFAAIARIHAL